MLMSGGDSGVLPLFLVNLMCYRFLVLVYAEPSAITFMIESMKIPNSASIETYKDVMPDINFLILSGILNC